MSGSALCIGHAAWDLCMHVDGYPVENSKAQTELLMESGGGPAANAAWLLAHWGVPTAFAGLIGQDDYGGRVLKGLAEVGIDCRLVEQRADHVTPVSFIIVNRANGSRTIINRKSSAGRLQVTSRSFQGLQPELLLFDGHEWEASFAAMEAFPSAVTILDAGSLREGTSRLAGKVRYLICSERFAAEVTGEAEVVTRWRECLECLRERYGNIVAITLGARGCAFDDGQTQERLPAFPAQARDTTAAGDVFHGAFAFAVLKGMALRKSLQLATLAAGLSVQQPGGRQSAPALSAVLERMPRD